MSSAPPPPCRCCNAESRFFDRAQVLGKYPVDYYRCASCGFIQPQAPFWLAESYVNPMTAYDLGGISRPTLNSKVTSAVLNLCCNPAGRLLDFGGGYGVFTRWMRDLGYDFWHHDKHCANLFANGFEGDVSGKTRYETATAFEVFEHLPNPAQTVAALFQLTDTILFTTDLVPEPAPRLEDWSYFGPEHGQHVAFYTSESLRHLAARLGARYHDGRGGFHLLTKRGISQQLFHLSLGSTARRFVRFFRRRPSLLPGDFEAAKARAKQAARADGVTTPAAALPPTAFP